MDRNRRWRVNPVQDLLDAAIQRENIKATCRGCRSQRVICSVGLWYHFHRKGWPDELKRVAARLRCRQCGQLRPWIDLDHEASVTETLPLPDDREWKRALSRRR